MCPCRIVSLEACGVPFSPLLADNCAMLEAQTGKEQAEGMDDVQRIYLLLSPGMLASGYSQID
jgi:hypothetical protein